MVHIRKMECHRTLFEYAQSRCHGKIRNQLLSTLQKIDDKIRFISRNQHRQSAITNLIMALRIWHNF